MISTPSTAANAQADAERGRLYTATDLLNISTDSSHRYELRRGELFIMPLAGYEHGILTAALGSRIHVYAEENQLGPVFAAGTGFLLAHNPDTVYAPDIAFVHKERLSKGKLPRGYFPGAPDLAVEVVSPNDRASQVQDKVQEWLRFGTKLVWVVDPKTKTVVIYRIDGSATVLQSGDILDGEDILPGFRYDLKKLFA